MLLLTQFNRLIQTIKLKRVISMSRSVPMFRERSSSFLQSSPEDNWPNPNSEQLCKYVIVKVYNLRTII